MSGSSCSTAFVNIEYVLWCYTIEPRVLGVFVLARVHEIQTGEDLLMVGGCGIGGGPSEGHLCAGIGCGLTTHDGGEHRADDQSIAAAGRSGAVGGPPCQSHGHTAPAGRQNREQLIALDCRLFWLHLTWYFSLHLPLDFHFFILSFFSV